MTARELEPMAFADHLRSAGLVVEGDDVRPCPAGPPPGALEFSFHHAHDEAGPLQFLFDNIRPETRAETPVEMKAVGKVGRGNDRRFLYVGRCHKCKVIFVAIGGRTP